MADEQVSLRRHVSDEEYRAAYADKDNRAVLAAVARKYSPYLSEHELSSCEMRALWRTLQYHRPGMGQKFTTNLHTFMSWECDREVRPYNRQKKYGRVFVFSDNAVRHEVDRRYTEEAPDHGPDLRAWLTLLPTPQRLLLEQHFLEELSMEEIGKIYGYSKETARKRVRKAIVMLRRLLRDEPEAEETPPAEEPEPWVPPEDEAPVLLDYCPARLLVTEA